MIDKWSTSRKYLPEIRNLVLLSCVDTVVPMFQTKTDEIGKQRMKMEKQNTTFQFRTVINGRRIHQSQSKDQI